MKKKNFDYFECLVDMSNFALKEAELLRQYFADFNPENMEAMKTELHALEHACDIRKHGMTTALVKEFLPPVDREDLFRLAHVTDNLTDCVESVIVFMYMANITKLRPDTLQFADLIIECCQGTVKALTEFRNFKKSDKVREYTILLNDLEEKGDKMYMDAVRRLSCEDTSTREIIEWRDVYRNFERCYDAAETIADNIESVIMKNA